MGKILRILVRREIFLLSSLKEYRCFVSNINAQKCILEYKQIYLLSGHNNGPCSSSLSLLPSWGSYSKEFECPICKKKGKCVIVSLTDDVTAPDFPKVNMCVFIA